MNFEDLKKLGLAYMEVLEKKNKQEDASNDKSDDGEGMDKVDPKALKKKFKDRKDKDLDNDGDEDDTDEYLHNRRKAISKNNEEDEKITCPKCKGEGCSHCDDKGYHTAEEAYTMHKGMKVKNVPRDAGKVAKKDNADRRAAQRKRLGLDDDVQYETVLHNRYERAHGKKANSREVATWVFTTKEMGNVDYNNPKQVYFAKGPQKLGAAGKEAAKALGTKYVYVMENVNESETLEEKNTEQFVWKDINMAMSYNGIKPATILRVLMTLNKLKSGKLSLRFKEGKCVSEKVNQTAGATPPEEIDSKDSPNAKKFKAMHKKEIDDTEEKGHDDASKAGRVTKPSPKRPGDSNLGDKNPLKKK